MKGPLARIGLWPRQWSAARMFAQTAKGFHIHPPSVPEGTSPNEWFQRLFVTEPENFSLRRYEEEQWDVMFFVQGRAEMILRESRAGLPRKTMRLFIDGDEHRGPNNVAVVIPPGRGARHSSRRFGRFDHGLRNEHLLPAEFEGRIASEVETASLPESWQRFLS